MRKKNLIAGLLILSFALCVAHLNATDLLVGRIDSNPQVAIAAGWVGDDSDDDGEEGVGDDEYTSVHALASGTGGTAEISVVAQCPITPFTSAGGAECTSALIATLTPADPGIAASFSDNFGMSSGQASGLFQVLGTTGAHGILKGIVEVDNALTAGGGDTDPYETNFSVTCGSFIVSGWMNPANGYGWEISIYGPDGYIDTVNMGTSANLILATEEFVTVGNQRAVATDVRNNRASWNGTTTIETMSLLSSFTVEQTNETAWPSSISVDTGEGPVTIWSSDW